MRVRCDNQYKTGADRGNILGQPLLFECIGICVLSPAHESKMRGYLVYVLIVNYLPIFLKFSHSILGWTALSWNFGGYLETILERSVDHVILRDYIVNRRFFFLNLLWSGLCARRRREVIAAQSAVSRFVSNCYLEGRGQFDVDCVADLIAAL